MKRRTFIKTLAAGAAMFFVNPLEFVEARMQGVDWSGIRMWRSASGEWHHVAVVRETTKFKYFLDEKRTNKFHIPVRLWEWYNEKTEKTTMTVELMPLEKTSDALAISGNLEFALGTEDFTIDFWATDKWIDMVRLQNGTSKGWRPKNAASVVKHLEKKIAVHPTSLIITNSPLDSD